MPGLYGQKNNVTEADALESLALDSAPADYLSHRAGSSTLLGVCTCDSAHPSRKRLH